MRTLLEQYQTVTEDRDDMRVGLLTVDQSCVITDCNDVIDQLEQFGPLAGWYCCQSGLYHFDEADQWKPDDTLGPILFGEVVRQTQSVHVQRTGVTANSLNSEEAWRLTSIRAENDDAGLIRHVDYLWHDPGDASSKIKTLRYEVCWRIVSDDLQPTHYRFAGYSYDKDSK